MNNLRGPYPIMETGHGAAFQDSLQPSDGQKHPGALNRPLTAGILGEAGAGKSSLINALLNVPIMPTQGVGGTRPIIILKYGNEHATYSVTSDKARHRLTSKAFHEAAMGRRSDESPGKKILYRSAELSRVTREDMEHSDPVYLEILYPLQILRDIEIIEYPGHYSLDTRRRLKWPPLAAMDIAIWTTVASSAWKRSEMQNWTELRPAPAEQSILAITQSDSLIFQEDRIKLMERLQKDAGDCFSCQRLVSAKYPPRAKGEISAAPDTGLETLKETISGLAASLRQLHSSRTSEIFDGAESNLGIEQSLVQPADPAYSV